MNAGFALSPSILVSRISNLRFALPQIPPLPLATALTNQVHQPIIVDTLAAALLAVLSPTYRHAVVVKLDLCACAHDIMAP